MTVAYKYIRNASVRVEKAAVSATW